MYIDFTNEQDAVRLNLRKSSDDLTRHKDANLNKVTRKKGMR